MLKQNNLEMQIKALLKSLPIVKTTSQADQNNGYRRAIKDVLKLLEPLMAHLQNRPRFSDDKYVKMMKFYPYEEAKTRMKEIVLDDKTKARVVFLQDDYDWHEELDKLKLGTPTNDFWITRDAYELKVSNHKLNNVCIKRKQLQDLIDNAEAQRKKGITHPDVIRGYKEALRELLK